MATKKIKTKKTHTLTITFSKKKYKKHFETWLSKCGSTEFERLYEQINSGEPPLFDCQDKKNLKFVDHIVYESRD